MLNIESLLKTDSTVILPVAEFPPNPSQGEIICIDKTIYMFSKLNGKTKWHSILGNNAVQSKPLNSYNLFSAVDLDNIGIKVQQEETLNTMSSNTYWFENVGNDVYIVFKKDNPHNCVILNSYEYNYITKKLKVNITSSNSPSTCKSAENFHISMNNEFISLEEHLDTFFMFDIEVLGSLIINRTLKILSSYLDEDNVYESVYHAGNDGKNSELNVIRLDGVSTKGFALTTHNHSNNIHKSHGYLNTSHPELRELIGKSVSFIKTPSITSVNSISDANDYLVTNDVYNDGCISAEFRDRYNKVLATQLIETGYNGEFGKAYWEISKTLDFGNSYLKLTSNNFMLFFDDQLQHGFNYIRVRYVIDNVSSMWSEPFEFKFTNLIIYPPVVIEITNTSLKAFVEINPFKVQDFYYDRFKYVKWTLIDSFGRIIDELETASYKWTSPNLKQLTLYTLEIVIFGVKYHSIKKIITFQTEAHEIGDLIVREDIDRNNYLSLTLKHDGSELAVTGNNSVTTLAVTPLGLVVSEEEFEVSDDFENDSRTPIQYFKGNIYTSFINDSGSVKYLHSEEKPSVAIIDNNTTIESLVSTFGADDIIDTFYMDTTFGIGWGSNDNVYKSLKIPLVPYLIGVDNIDFEISGEYDGINQEYGILAIGVADNKAKLMHFDNRWDDGQPMGQTLLCYYSNNEIFKNQKEVISHYNISSTTNVYGDLYISMKGLNQFNNYSKRYISKLTINYHPLEVCEYSSASSGVIFSITDEKIIDRDVNVSATSNVYYGASFALSTNILVSANASFEDGIDYYSGTSRLYMRELVDDQYVPNIEFTASTLIPYLEISTDESTIIQSDGIVFPLNDNIVSSKRNILAVYKKTQNNWVKKQFEFNSIGDTTITNYELEGLIYEEYRESSTLSHDGNIVIIGAPHFIVDSIQLGIVYIYTYDGSFWNIKKIELPNVEELIIGFGSYVELSSDSNRLYISSYRTAVNCEDNDDDDCWSDYRNANIYVYELDKNTRVDGLFKYLYTIPTTLEYIQYMELSKDDSTLAVAGDNSLEIYI